MFHCNLTKNSWFWRVYFVPWCIPNALNSGLHIVEDQKTFAEWMD
jgi:hypothetical protein